MGFSGIGKSAVPVKTEISVWAKHFTVHSDEVSLDWFATNRVRFKLTQILT